MASRIGRRTAILATSGLVSVAVTLGAGAGVAQAAPYGGEHHGKQNVKKERVAVSYERVLWFDHKDKKEHKKKDHHGKDEKDHKKKWPGYDDEAADPTADEPGTGFEGPGGDEGWGGFDDSALLPPTGGFDDPSAPVVDPTAAVVDPAAPVVDPTVVDGPVAGEEALAGPYDKKRHKKKHDNISKRKDAISYERVLWFENEKKKHHKKHDKKEYGEESYGDDSYGDDSYGDDDPYYGGDSYGDDSYGDPGDWGTPGAVEEPVAYSPRPGGDYKHHEKKNLVKKKIRITFEKVLWFEKKHDKKKHHEKYDKPGKDDYQWGDYGDYGDSVDGPSETSAVVGAL
ncbi:hypothetical protein [Parafrankia sp. EUN1f]|uniref:hypothetical protein n=1 Tax=Parafrankia sp. EUN1f TaxID=102897 RepID=UPI0001C44210|nr:hypothetical protein [Parafrankia sp. EUN1f]EFC85822.1 hypothetical protein FrEUN1fDRAFT_0974 [Parafrankia sp. EUN1f]